MEQKFLWLVSSYDIEYRDIEEVFASRQKAEKYAESEIERMSLCIKDKSETEYFTEYSCTNDVDIFVGHIPYNKDF